MLFHFKFANLATNVVINRAHGSMKSVSLFWFYSIYHSHENKFSKSYYNLDQKIWQKVKQSGKITQKRKFLRIILPNLEYLCQKLILYMNWKLYHTWDCLAWNYTVPKFLLLPSSNHYCQKIFMIEHWELGCLHI